MSANILCSDKAITCLAGEESWLTAGEHPDANQA